MNQRHTRSICFASLHCLVYCLDSIVFNADGRRIRFGEKQERKQNKSKSKVQKRQIYPLPFLFLLDFFLGRTISIHFCILAPNIAALICLCRPTERVSSLECVVCMFHCGGGVVFTFFVRGLINQLFMTPVSCLFWLCRENRGCLKFLILRAYLQSHETLPLVSLFSTCGTLAANEQNLFISQHKLGFIIQRHHRLSQRRN